MSTRRGEFIKACLDLIQLPYLYDGKGFPGEAYNGRDCSGLVTERLHFIGGPDLRGDWNTSALWGRLPQPVVFQSGDLCLYARPDGTPHHVMVFLGIDELVVGAAGGDETTTTLVRAREQGARVQAWLSKDYMQGFLGFRRIPWLDEEEMTNA